MMKTINVKTCKNVLFVSIGMILQTHISIPEIQE